MKKLTEIMGDNWKIFEGDANPLYDAYIVEANAPNDVKTIAEDAKKKLKVSLRGSRWRCQYRKTLQVSFIYPCLGTRDCCFVNFYRSFLDFKYHSYYHYFPQSRNSNHALGRS